FMRSVPAGEAASAFLKRFYREWLDAAYAVEPELSQFKLDRHEESIRNFRDLDIQSIDRCHERIRTKILANAIWRSDGLDAPTSSERGILLREVNKRRRHLPLRILFKQIATLLPKLKPCLMMSPLAVSTFLDSE